ncbi:MAG: hypothetical protein WC180_05025 [Candidatus Paceibacterota bacterium]|jgi:hypothetical protein
MQESAIAIWGFPKVDAGIDISAKKVGGTLKPGVNVSPKVNVGGFPDLSSASIFRSAEVRSI